MQLKWRQVYSELTEFIAEHPEVKIGTSVIRIPSSYSSEFYSLHAKARMAFVEEKLPYQIKKSQELGENYKKIEEEVSNLLELKSVSIIPTLHRFLCNPVDQLIKEIFSPFFSLLKGQIDIEKYEKVALQNIEASFRSLYRSGYEKWVILSLVKLLKADKVFRVIPEEFTEDDTLRHGGLLEHKIPSPEDADNISFRRENEVGFMVPDLLIHAAVSDRYFSFTSEIIKALAVATNASGKREWLPGDSTVVFESGIILVYVDNNLEDLSLVTDVKRTCRADLVIECRDQKDWYEKEGFDKIRIYHNKYKPRLGTYIVTIEPAPEQAYTNLISENVLAEDTASEQKPDHTGIHLITVGFDQAKLEPVIKALNDEQKNS